MKEALVVNGNRKGVLVCDDERHVVRLLQVNLERQGYSVQCAFGGNGAIALLEGNRLPIDLAIVDYDMGRVSGYEVLSWIRSNEKMKAIWIALMFSRPEDRAKVEQMQFRADLYVDKPFNPKMIFP